MPLKKITLSHFNSLKPAEQEILRSLGLEIDEEEKPVPPPKLKDSILQSYACVVETYCKLCKTTTIQVFSMEGVGGILVSKESKLEDIEGMTVKTRTETVLTCAACHDILKLMTQEDLISLTLKAARGECRCTIRRN